MIKNLLLAFFLFSFTVKSFSQTIAYSATINKAWGSGCIDLQLTDKYVRGHQKNVTVSYYLTETDANNQANALPRFYSNTSNPQTIYGRVDNDLNSDFALAIQTISYSHGSNPPPPGLCSYQLCDPDNNGSELAYLDNLVCGYGGLGFPSGSFCSSGPNDVETRFYLTEDDAINEVNEVSSVYSVTALQDFFYKIKNVVTNQNRIGTFSIELITCSIDSDADGIPDLAEDANHDIGFSDDDTDKDGLRNYLDNDDDGDNILTIDEDYNGNGNPLDDDTDSSSVPDYLEANVALSVNSETLSTLKIFPNPAKHYVTISSSETLEELEMTLYTILGKRMMRMQKTIDQKGMQLDVSTFPSGLYFISIGTKNKQSTYKIIIE